MSVAFTSGKSMPNRFQVTCIVVPEDSQTPTELAANSIGSVAAVFERSANALICSPLGKLPVILVQVSDASTRHTVPASVATKTRLKSCGSTAIVVMLPPKPFATGFNSVHVAPSSGLRNNRPPSEAQLVSPLP